MTDEYVERLRANRREKDDFFADHPQSPIPPEHRDGFDGLDYFPPDPDYRVEATVTVHDDPEPVEMETTASNPVRYLRVVTFAVTLDFNLAYNPFCAYSETFACPLPPEENWLEIVVPAGERAPDIE